jgi:PAS domain S-box-containing protein
MVVKKFTDFLQGKSEHADLAISPDSPVFKEILNNLPSLVCIKNRDGVYTMVNYAFLDLAGVKRSEVIGKNDVEIGLFLNPEQIMEADAQVFTSGQKKHIPVEPFTSKHGELYWFTTNKIPIKDENGEIEAIAIISDNITSKISSEQQLKKSEQRYKSIFENNYSGIIVVSKELRILNKNRAFNSLVGINLNFLGIDDLNKYISPEDAKDLRDLMNGVISRNYEYFDLRLQLNNLKTKSLVETLCFVRGLYNQSGVFTEAVVTFQDISDQIKSQKELEDSESRFRTIVENATEAILLLDFDSEMYIDLNDNAMELFGYTAAEFEEASLGDLSPINQASGENSREKSNEYMARAMKGERVVYEWIVRRKDGKLVPCEVRLVRLPYRDKNIVRISVIDITERKKAEHLLNLEKQKLQSSNTELVDVNHRLEDQKEQLQEFAYIASHNLRSPAGNIKALLDFYSNDPNEENLGLMLDKLSIVSDDLMDTINDLAKVVQIKNEVSKDREDVYLLKVLEKTKESLSQTFTNLNATISTNLTDEIKIYAPKTYIESIFLNFISNALKYSKDNVPPKLQVDYSETKSNVVLEFKDNGLGIDLNKFRTKLFGLRKTFHKNKDSRGVGLFITKAQVEAIGGSVDVKSEVDKGSEFKLTFPKSILKK